VHVTTVRTYEPTHTAKTRSITPPYSITEVSRHVYDIIGSYCSGGTRLGMRGFTPLNAEDVDTQ